MTRFPLEGGCHCGAVRFSLKEPAFSVQHCHCERCRKVYGTMFGTGAVVKRSAVSITGEKNLSVYRSTPSFPDYFCKTCGCHLFAYEESEPEIMYLAVWTLDGGVHPDHPEGSEAHTYMRSKAEWDHTGKPLPTYATLSPDEIVTGLQRTEGAGPARMEGKANGH